MPSRGTQGPPAQGWLLRLERLSGALSQQIHANNACLANTSQTLPLGLPFFGASLDVFFADSEDILELHLCGRPGTTSWASSCDMSYRTARTRARMVTVLYEAPCITSLRVHKATTSMTSLEHCQAQGLLARATSVWRPSGSSAQACPAKPPSGLQHLLANRRAVQTLPNRCLFMAAYT